MIKAFFFMLFMLFPLVVFAQENSHSNDRPIKINPELRQDIEKIKDNRLKKFVLEKYINILPQNIKVISNDMANVLTAIGMASNGDVEESKIRIIKYGELTELVEFLINQGY